MSKITNLEVKAHLLGLSIPFDFTIRLFGLIFIE